MLFMFLNILNSLRILQKFNTIFMVIESSSQMIAIFTFFTIIVSAFMVPLAQSIWATNYFGYKTFKHCICSIMMLNYSKGNLESILYFNQIFSITFMGSYYLIFGFLCRAAFCHLQKNAVRQVCLQTGFQEDIIEMNNK